MKKIKYELFNETRHNLKNAYLDYIEFECKTDFTIIHNIYSNSNQPIMLLNLNKKIILEIIPCNHYHRVYFPSSHKIKVHSINLIYISNILKNSNINFFS